MGRVLPVGTDLIPVQAAVLQNLAWYVVQNYPDCGLYQEGTIAVGPPKVSPAPANITDLPSNLPEISSPPEDTKDVTRVMLNSSTPGAWFRYTLDGTTPTRTCGYVYCGLISIRPGTILKAIAYKSGMIDSPIVEMTYPAANGSDK
jgi:hypothetical protein